MKTIVLLMKTIVLYFKRNWITLFFFIIAILTIIITTEAEEAKGELVIVGNDTCTVKFQNRFTSNYRVVNKQGKEFTAKESEVIFTGLIAGK